MKRDNNPASPVLIQHIDQLTARRDPLKSFPAVRHVEFRKNADTA
jgi:hypothetical protein